MNIKKCTECGRTLPLTAFHSHKKHRDGLQARCKECVRAINRGRYHEKLKYDQSYKNRVKITGKRWHEANRESANDRTRKNDRAKREACINHYGGSCECCGEKRYEFLSIDHVHGGGVRHRGEVGNKIHRWLIKNNFPPGFRILCHNCNQALGHYGYCPHDMENRGVRTA